MIAWGAKQIPITQTIAVGQSQFFRYTLDKPSQQGVLNAVIDILDTTNTWFSLMGAASLKVSVDNNSFYESSTLSLEVLFKLHRDGKLQTVIPLYQQAIQRDQAQYTLILPKLAEALIQVGRTEAATIELAKGIASLLNPESRLHCQILLAELYYEANDFMRAIIEVEQVLSVEARNYQALMILALCKAQSGEFVAAQEAVDLALELFEGQNLPSYMVKRLEQFNVTLDQAQSKVVLKYAAILTERDSLNPYHFYHLGYYLFRQLDFAEAEKLLLAAIEIYPYTSIFYKNLATLYLRHNKLDEAESACQILLKKSPLNIQNHLLYAKVLSLKQDYQASKRILHQASKINPANIDLINWLGFIA